MPHSFSNAYTSGTECRIDLKPGCKFKLVRCLKVYKKNRPIWPIKGPWRALLEQGSPEISLAWSILGSMWESMKVQEGPLSPCRVPQGPKRCSKMVRGALTLCTMQNWYKHPEIGKKILRFILGALQGPLKDQDGSWTQQGSTFMSLESLDMFFVVQNAKLQKIWPISPVGHICPPPED